MLPMFRADQLGNNSSELSDTKKGMKTFIPFFVSAPR
jgi:hypothetical protein